MSTTTVVPRAILATALCLLSTACAPESEPAQVRLPNGAAQSTAPSELAQRMSEHSLDTMDAVEMVDHLDRLDVDQRPGDLAISVRPREVVLSLEDEEKWVTMPDDRFYLSVVPYVEQPQDCVHHSLTTSQGELVTESVRVKVKDRTNDVVLLDEAVTTFENGSIGLWLPRDIRGTVKVTYGEEGDKARFTTSDDSATCLTTLRVG